VLHDSTWLHFLCPLCASSAGVVVLNAECRAEYGISTVQGLA